MIISGCVQIICSRYLRLTNCAIAALKEITIIASNLNVFTIPELRASLEWKKLDFIVNVVHIVLWTKSYARVNS